MTIHKKYGHLSENRIKLAIRDGLVNFGFDYSTIKDQKLPFCIDCMRGRMKASARKNTTHTQYGLFEKIAHDWKGPFPIKSVNGYSGYHLFSDNYSNWLWAYFDKGKDRLFGAVIRLHKTFIDEKTRVIPLVTQPNWRVFQSDYENVNISRGLRDWIKDQGIFISLSVPYRHDQNGQIERDIGNVLDRTRSIMSEYNVNPSFWDYATKHAIYLINRSPTSRADHKTPFELLTGEKPELSNLIPFYCPGVYHVSKEEDHHTGAFSYRANICHFLGYDEESTGCIIHCYASGSIKVRSDCIFDSEVFKKFWSKDEYPEYTWVNEYDIEKIGKEVYNSKAATDPDIPEELKRTHPGDVSSVIRRRGKHKRKNPRGHLQPKSIPEFLRPVHQDDGIRGSYESDSEIGRMMDSDYETGDEELIVDPKHQDTRGIGSRVRGMRKRQPFWERYVNNTISPYPTKPSGLSFWQEIQQLRIKDRLCNNNVIQSSMNNMEWIDSEYETDDNYENEESDDEVVFTATVDASKGVHRTIKLPPIPKHLAEALDESNTNHNEWRNALIAELENMETYNIFEIAEEQKGHGLKTKLVFATSLKNDYTIKFKIRLVAKGFTQKFGIDYNETFSPTTSVTVILMLWDLCARRDARNGNFDVKGAFLEGKDKQFTHIFCSLPKELNDGIKPLRVRLLGNLYGTKQAAKVWNDQLHEILVNIGFERCPVEPCLYRFIGDNGVYIYVAVWVDDGLVVASSEEVMETFFSELRRHVKEITVFNPTERFVGLDVIRDHKNRYIHVNQKQYISEAEVEGYEHTKDEKLPMSSTTNLRVEEPDKDGPSLLPLIGKVRYAADRTRSDVLTSLGELSTGGMKEASKEHVKASKRLWNYFKSTSELGIRLGGRCKCKPFMFVDAAYITTGNTRSRSGCAIFTSLDTGSIYTHSKNDTVTSHSSTEAELRAADIGIRSLIHIQDLLVFVGDYQYGEPSIVYIDNRSAIDLCKTLRSTHKTKHILVTINFIRECINNRRIILKFVPTEWNIADTLTKPLPIEKFNRFNNFLMNGFSGQELEFMESKSVTYAVMCDRVDMIDSTKKRMNPIQVLQVSMEVYSLI